VLEKAKDFKDPHKWTGLGDQTRRMAMEEDVYGTRQTGRPATAEFDYKVIYRWTSHYVHATVVSLRSHAVERREAFVVHSTKGESVRLRELALFNTLTYLAKIVICGFRGLKSSLPTRLSDKWDSVVKSFFELRKRRIRSRQIETRALP